MKISGLLIASFIPLMDANAQAVIYSWKDSRGDTHYVNSMYDVPERYLSKVIKLDLGIEEKNAANQQQGAATENTPPASSPALAPPPPSSGILTPAEPARSPTDKIRKSTKRSRRHDD